MWFTGLIDFSQKLWTNQCLLAWRSNTTMLPLPLTPRTKRWQLSSTLSEQLEGRQQ